MPEVDTSNGDPALAYLTEQRDNYSATLTRLKAQHKGVEAKMISTQAKLEAIEEAIEALAKMSAKKTNGD